MRVNVFKKLLVRELYGNYIVETLKPNDSEQVLVILANCETYNFVCSFKFSLITGAINHFICDTTIDESKQILYIVDKIGKLAGKWSDEEL